MSTVKVSVPVVVDPKVYRLLDDAEAIVSRSPRMSDEDFEAMERSVLRRIRCAYTGRDFRIHLLEHKK